MSQRACCWGCVVALLAATAGWWLGRSHPVLPTAADSHPAELPASTEALRTQGAALVAHHHCQFCHVTPPDHAITEPRADCQACHRQLARPSFIAPPLAVIAARRPDDWLRRYLRAPFPIREAPSSRMPDLQLEDCEIEVLARYLELLANPLMPTARYPALQREPHPDRERMIAGEQLFATHGCGRCHALGAHQPDPPSGGMPNDPARMAPDLSELWLRVRPAWLPSMLLAPTHHLGTTWMPKPVGLTEPQAEVLAYYLLNAVPTPPATAGWLEVERLIATHCLACHYGPLGDAAPLSANPAGGAGFLRFWGQAPRGLSLMTYQELMQGALDDLGQRRQVVTPYDRHSLVLQHLTGTKHPLMPYAMDPLPPAAIETFVRWVRAGALGPDHHGEGVRVSPPIELGR